jgi:prephenate dehydrogenase
LTTQFTISIVGLGLMGGSLALALRAAEQPRWREARLVGMARNKTTLAAAVADGAVDEGTSDLAQAVCEADLVVLGTPVRTILRLLPEVARHAKAGAVVIDMGSSKAAICAGMAELPARVQPVGGHPLCGKELAGYASAEATLYQGKVFVLCPLPNTSPDALRLAQDLALAIGARPLISDAETHDRAVAAISHVPYAAAAALVRAFAAGDEPLAWELASSGFRDTTRLAGSDVDMMLDILLTNRPAVLEWMDRLSGSLGEIRCALADGREDVLRDMLTLAQETRTNLAQRMKW